MKQELWCLPVTLVNAKTGSIAEITYPCSNAEMIEALARCKTPYGSGAYYHKVTLRSKGPFHLYAKKIKKRPSPSTMESSRIRARLMALFNGHVRPIMDYGDDNASPFVAEAAF